MKQKAGVVLYRQIKDAEPEILVISSRKHPGSWVFPVGTAEKHESRRAAAERECTEETGYIAELRDKLGTIESAAGAKSIRFTFFLGTIVDSGETAEPDRQLVWIPVSRLVETVPEIFRTIAREAIGRIDGNRT